MGPRPTPTYVVVDREAEVTVRVETHDASRNDVKVMFDEDANLLNVWLMVAGAGVADDDDDIWAQFNRGHSTCTIMMPDIVFEANDIFVNQDMDAGRIDIVMPKKAADLPDFHKVKLL
ncbi:hypothetical protein PBRA_003278 [Plasmodiophora brassicae]|uniref:SHSP domain-containing protein n=1 Tax=Plasmodiophora brassicae TaxID=37360 RepID=A0A0G4J8U0_PLABS|nr:hypothetical protein PBRA_003278 [Plasmodiophora brassicae]